MKFKDFIKKRNVIYVSLPEVEINVKELENDTQEKIASLTDDLIKARLELADANDLVNLYDKVVKTLISECYVSKATIDMIVDDLKSAGKI